MTDQQFRYIHRNDETIAFLPYQNRRIMCSVTRNGHVTVTPIGYSVSYSKGRVWGNTPVSVVEPADKVPASDLELLAQQRISGKVVVNPALSPEDFAIYEKRCDDYNRQSAA
jgi:hypothetical protein